MADTRVKAKSVIGKTIISEETGRRFGVETGRRFGVVSNVDFVTESGELLNIVVAGATKALKDLNLKEDDKGRLLIPFSAVKSIGDFVVVSENELL
ncbi:MAG: PRC-barrel domain-containing protein [Candidatus Aenigmarchaeota archaeon]|nr:PRC-barrel domain-containing protein [Candidatus Aenigmarchaeota archaeon]